MFMGSSTRRRQARCGLIGLAVAIAIAVAGCGAAEQESASDSAGVVSEEVKAAVEREGPIEVIENNWSSQLVQTRLGFRVLEEMGADVSITPIEYLAGFPAMANSDNRVHMEVWDLTAKPQIEQYVQEEKSVIDLGPSGPTAEEGWYVPTYVIEGDPERGIEPACPDLPDWRALNKCAEVFGTAETGDKGRYLSGDGSWGKLYGDPKRIKNLKLNYEMIFAGSEAALVAEIRRAYERGDPILALMWKPHYVTSKYDLTLIEFPEYKDGCWETTYACGWDDISLRKLASRDFPSAHPTTAAFLRNYSVSDEDLAEILVAVEEGATVEAAVDDWMEANPRIWQEWIPDRPAT